MSTDSSAGIVLTILTVGHSTRTIAELIDLVQAHKVASLVDVRMTPGSRRHPHFNRDALAVSLPAAGIDYTHIPGLGGRRKPRPDSPNTGWRNEGFRGYADYMRTPEFEESLKTLLALVEEKQVAIMCSEAVPWRCHRSLISDALTVRGWTVEHVLSPKHRYPHVLTSWAVVEGAQLTYPPGAEAEGEAEEPDLQPRLL